MSKVNIFKIVLIVILCKNYVCADIIEVGNSTFCCNRTAGTIIKELRDMQEKEQAENAAKLIQVTNSLELITNRLNSLNNLIYNQSERILDEIRNMEPNSKLRDLMREERNHLLSAITDNAKNMMQDPDSQETEAAEDSKETKGCTKDHQKLSRNQLVENINRINAEISKLYNQSQACASETNRINDIYSFLTSYHGCDEAMYRNRFSGVYSLVAQKSSLPPFKAFCLKDKRQPYAPAWTIIQRRQSNSSHFIDFNRSWNEYKTGFGNPRFTYWLGLDNIHALLNSRRHELWIYLENEAGDRLNSYHDDFVIGDESDEYTIHSLGKNTGGADMRNCTNVAFNTRDRGDTSWANSMGGTGFWGPCKLSYNSQRIGRNGKPYMDFNLYHKEIVYVHFGIRPVRPKVTKH